MQAHPVHYSVAYPSRLARIQLLARLVAFLALGLVGISFGAIFGFLYLVLPVLAAARLSSGDRYQTEDGPRVLQLLRWLAAVMGWAAMITDRLPTSSPEEAIQIRVDRFASPSAAGALLRVITGVPSALGLWIVGFVGAFVWLWAALSVLLNERVGRFAFNYLVGVQRWSIRLLTYQAGLTDEYPPFSFDDQLPLELSSTNASEQPCVS